MSRLVSIQGRTFSGRHSKQEMLSIPVQHQWSKVAEITHLEQVTRLQQAVTKKSEPTLVQMLQVSFLSKTLNQAKQVAGVSSGTFLKQNEHKEPPAASEAVQA